MANLSASIQIRGLKEIDAALRGLPDEVSGPIIESALAEAGEVIRRAAVENIDSRTGKTAADLRVEVQIEAANNQGVAAVGGTSKGSTGRAHVLRWLELGTKPHKIVAGAQDRRDARRAARALRSIGDRNAATALRRGVRDGSIRVRRALSLPGGVFRAAVSHPGSRPESPLTRALAEQGNRAIAVFRERLWQGIVAATSRLRKAP